MATQVIYKSGAKWVVNQYRLDAGSCLAVESADGLNVKLSLKSNLTTVAVGLYTEYQDASGTPYTKASLLALLDEFLNASAGQNGTPAILEVELTRPDDTTEYTAGDAMGAATAKVKMVSTVSLTGSGGTATISGTGGISRVLTYNTSPTVTASDFVTAFADDYLALDISVVVTSSDAGLIFTAAEYDETFVEPVITNVTEDLNAEITHTTANRAAVAQKETFTLSGTAATKQKETITITGVASATQQETVTLEGTAPTQMKVTIPLTGTAPSYHKVTVPLTGTIETKQKETITITGSSGTFTITGTGGFTNLVTFDTDEDGTAAAFANATNIAEYASAGITLSANLHTIIFEAEVAGVSFTAPTCTDGVSDLHGAVEHTTPALATGTGNLKLTGKADKLITFDTNLTTTAANFVTAYDTEYYLGEDITLTSDGDNLIFESLVLGMDLGTFDVENLTGDLGHGTIAQTTPLVVVGTANLTVVGLDPKLITFNTDIATTISDFVTLWDTEYYAGEGITLTGSATEIILESDTLGVPFGIPDVVTLTGNLTHGTIEETVAYVAVGTATIAAGDTFSALATYTTDIAGTVAAFDSAENKAAALLDGIVLTHSGDTLIFTANVEGTGFTSPTVTNVTGDLDDASIVVDQENVPIGTANVINAGGLTKLITYDTDAATTVAAFDSVDNKAAYLAEGIVLTHSGNTLIMEAETTGVLFTSPVVDTAITGTIAGSVEVTVVGVEQGTATITGIGDSKTVTFNTSATQTATDFAELQENIDYYDGLGIDLTSSTTKIIFTAQEAGTGFTEPIFTNTGGDLAGVLATTAPNHYANVTAVKQVETILVTGDDGEFTIESAGGLSKVVTFASNIQGTISTFVTDNAEDYLAQAIVLTGTTTEIVMTAEVAGTGFTAPTVTGIVGNIEGTVVTTDMVSLLPLTLTGASTVVGGGGVIMGLKVESDITTLAAKDLRLWFYNAVPTEIVGDNVAFVTLYANKSARLFYIDVTMDVLLVNSDNVIGLVDLAQEYVTVDGNLYLVIQPLSGFVPTAEGAVTVTLNVIKL